MGFTTVLLQAGVVIWCLTVSNAFQPPTSTRRFPYCKVLQFKRGFQTSDSSFRQRRHKPLKDSMWESDDVSWSGKAKRRLRGRMESPTETPVRDTIVGVNVLAFVWQTVSTLQYIAAKFPAFWKTDKWSMISDAAIDAGTTTGPLMRDFMFSAALGKSQPHRYLTAGFLHGGILHLVMNMYALRQIPNWVETGLGRPLYITTYLVGIVAGNRFHAKFIGDEFLGCLGSSGGIVALAGLAFAALVKMDNQKASLEILKSMAALLCFGALVPSLSNASHIGGFLAGCFMGTCFSPGYRTSYSLKRKNSMEVDDAPRDFRLAMGFGVVPNKDPPISLRTLWIAVILFAATEPKLQTMPALVLKGLLSPGSLTGTLI